MRFCFRIAVVLLTTASAFFVHGGKSRGDIFFIGANSDESEHFAFVALSDYGVNTVINFTDSSFGNNVAGEENRFRWTEHFAATPGGPLTLTMNTALTKGQVVIYNDIANRFERPGGIEFGVTSGVEMDFGTGGENIFAYQGVVSQLAGASTYRGDASGVTRFDGAFLWGTGSSSWQTTGPGATDNSYLPTVPNTPTNFAASTTLDNFRYNGSRTFDSDAEMLAALSNLANWTGDNANVANPGDFGGDFTITAVPEPSSIALLSIVGLGGVLSRRFRRGRVV